MLISTDLSSYSAVQQSCTPSSTCSFIFFHRGEPCPFFNDHAFQNSNCSEKRSFQIMRFWQIIGKWLGIAYRDLCGWVNLMYSVIKLGISQKILSISRSTADNFKNVQSFVCNLTSFEIKVISKALGVNILSKW